MYEPDDLTTLIPTLKDLGVGIALGSTLGVYHFCYQNAAKMEKRASNLGILLNLRDVFIYLFDVLVLGNPLVFTNVLGACLITFSSLLIFFNNKK